MYRRELNKFGEYTNVVDDKNCDAALKICLSDPCTVNGNSDAKATNSIVRSLPFFGGEYAS